MENKIQFIPHKKEDLDYFDDIVDGLDQNVLTEHLSVGSIKTNTDFILHFIEDKLTLQDEKTKQSFCVDFNSGKNYYRTFIDNTKSMLIKAIEGRIKDKLHVVDATAGFGGDLFQIAARGHNVMGIEQNLIVYLLLKDALIRAEDNPQTHPITQKINLVYGNACQLLSQIKKSDVIYLDPMFPESKKSAKVQKEMQLLQFLNKSQLEDTNNNFNLFNIAQESAKKIVVKRPASGIYLADSKPTSSLTGKSNRFDIYAIN